MTARQLKVTTETWPLAEPFIIARSTRTETEVVLVELEQDGAIGRGESVPSPRYGEDCQSVAEQIIAIKDQVEQGDQLLTRDNLQELLPAGSARNAMDAALWDLQAKLSEYHVGQLTSLRWPNEVNTVQTISISAPERMGRDAQRFKDFPLLKVKLDSEQIIQRVQAVNVNAPKASILIDANESWSLDILNEVAPQLGALGVVMIEQPLAAGKDELLAGYQCPLPLAADESCHTRKDLDYLVGKYDVINIKLDKTGGLTEAIALMEEGQAKGFDIMLGCMVSTSLGIAPAMFLADKAKYVDLDAPGLLVNDRPYNLTINAGVMSALSPKLWGA